MALHPFCRWAGPPLLCLACRLPPTGTRRPAAAPAATACMSSWLADRPGCALPCSPVWLPDPCCGTGSSRPMVLHLASHHRLLGRPPLAARRAAHAGRHGCVRWEWLHLRWAGRRQLEPRRQPRRRRHAGAVPPRRAPPDAASLRPDTAAGLLNGVVTVSGDACLFAETFVIDFAKRKTLNTDVGQSVSCAVRRTGAARGAVLLPRGAAPRAGRPCKASASAPQPCLLPASSASARRWWTW